MSRSAALANAAFRRGFFVTGTDTGVGKTVVAAMLALGLDGVYWKPVQTGREEGTDRASVRRWTGLPESRLWPEVYCLPSPVSPHLAAARAGVRISLRRCLRPPASLPAAAPAETLRPLIIEGAGGLFVPLNRRHLMLDLIAGLRLPVVLVTRSTLGTINHTLLSLAALRARRIPIAAVVMNGVPDVHNQAAVRFYGGLDRARVGLAVLPPLPRLAPAPLRAAFRRCAPALGSMA